jgi:hypothetical protein
MDNVEKGKDGPHLFSFVFFLAVRSTLFEASEDGRATEG